MGGRPSKEAPRKAAPRMSAHFMDEVLLLCSAVGGFAPWQKPYSFFGSSIMGGAKKPRLASFLQTVGLSIPLTVIARIANELKSSDADDDDIMLQNVPREMKRMVSGISTPCGPVVKHMYLPLKSGGTLDFPICCPFALLNFLCDSNPKFENFLKTHTADRECSIAVWADETTSGNQQRHDMRRTFISFYLCICDIPQFFRSADHGWWPIGVLSYDSMKEVAGEASALMKYILRFFFTGSGNFADGARVGRQSQFLLRGRLSAVLQDEKGIKTTASVKGASGTKCCLMCRNVLKTDVGKVCVGISDRASVFEVPRVFAEYNVYVVQFGIMSLPRSHSIRALSRSMKMAFFNRSKGLGALQEQYNGDFSIQAMLKSTALRFRKMGGAFMCLVVIRRGSTCTPMKRFGRCATS